MLIISKKEIDSTKDYPIYLIDTLTKEYIVNSLFDKIDFSELETRYSYIYDTNDKIEELKNNVHITGYETGTQHSPNNLFISIYLGFIHNKYDNYNIDYYTEPRTFDGTYEEIEKDIYKYLDFFNSRFNKILKELETNANNT